MSPIRVLVTLAVLARGAARAPRTARAAPQPATLDGAASGATILDHLQEMAAGYRFYIQLSEQKAGFLFVTWTGVLTFAVGRLDLFRSAWETARWLYVFSLLILFLACAAALLTVVESEFVLGRARSGRRSRRRGSLAVVYAPAYAPLGHDDLCDASPAHVITAVEGATHRALSLDLAGELKQLARMHEQRRRTLPFCVWSGIIGAFLFYSAATFRMGPHVRARRPTTGAPTSATALPPSRPALPSPARPPDRTNGRDSGATVGADSGTPGRSAGGSPGERPGGRDAGSRRPLPERPARRKEAHGLRGTDATAPATLNTPV